MLTSKIFCGILFPMSTLNDHQETKILTQVKKVDAQHPDMTIIREAAEIIRTGWFSDRNGIWTGSRRITAGRGEKNLCSKRASV